MGPSWVHMDPSAPYKEEGNSPRTNAQVDTSLFWVWMVDKSKHTRKYVYANKTINITFLGLDDGSKSHLPKTILSTC